LQYYVRNEKDEELVCPSLADLDTLYRQGFLTDDDEVRSERSERWERIGDFAPLGGERTRRSEKPKVLFLLGLAALAAAAIWLLARAR